MTKSKWMRRLGLGAAGLGIVYGVLDWNASAQPPEDRNSPPSREAVVTLKGIVAEFSENDHGDIDGLLLKDGKLVHFPPHIGAEVTEAISVGDEIAVNGREETRPRGERVFAAESITADGASIDVAPPRGPEPRGRMNEPPMNAVGVVKELSINPHDDVDGFTLEDGTVVKFPPHQGAALAELVALGDKVEVEGRRHETPEGEVHLRADRISVAGGKSLERSEPRGRPTPSPHHPGPPHAGPHGHAGPHPGDVQGEILHELREIRRLLEDRAER